MSGDAARARRADYGVLRGRCEHDDGSDDHYALDIQQPYAIGTGGPTGLMRRLSRCRCKGKMLVILPDDPEPMTRNPPAPAGATRRADHPVMRVRCRRDDGTSAHYALDLHAPVDLARKGPLDALSKMKLCSCGENLAVLPVEDEEPMERNAREAGSK